MPGEQGCPLRSKVPIPAAQRTRAAVGFTKYRINGAWSARICCCFGSKLCSRAHGSVCGGSPLPQLGVLPPRHLQNLSLPRLFWGACQNFSSRTEEFYVLNLNLLLPNFERDHILVDMENYEYLLAGNYVSLIVCDGGKLHGEVVI